MAKFWTPIRKTRKYAEACRILRWDNTNPRRTFREMIRRGYVWTKSGWIKETA